MDAAPDVSGGSRIPDVIHPDGYGGSRMEFLPGWNSYLDGNPTRMEFLPGWKSYPDGIPTRMEMSWMQLSSEGHIFLISYPIRTLFEALDS